MYLVGIAVDSVLRISETWNLIVNVFCIIAIVLKKQRDLKNFGHQASAIGEGLNNQGGQNISLCNKYDALTKVGIDE